MYQKARGKGDAGGGGGGEEEKKNNEHVDDDTWVAWIRGMGISDMMWREGGDPLLLLGGWGCSCGAMLRLGIYGPQKRCTVLSF